MIRLWQQVRRREIIRQLSHINEDVDHSRETVRQIIRVLLSRDSLRSCYQIPDRLFRAIISLADESCVEEGLIAVDKDQDMLNFCLQYWSVSTPAIVYELAYKIGFSLIGSLVPLPSRFSLILKIILQIVTLCLHLCQPLEEILTRSVFTQMVRKTEQNWTSKSKVVSAALLLYSLSIALRAADSCTGPSPIVDT